MKVFQDLIRHESLNLTDYKFFGKPTKLSTDRAYRHIKDNLVVRNGSQFIYNRPNGSSETISTKEPKTCTCDLYFDKAMCSHLIAACIIDKVNIIGLKKKVNLIVISDLF